MFKLEHESETESCDSESCAASSDGDEERRARLCGRSTQSEESEYGDAVIASQSA